MIGQKTKTFCKQSIAYARDRGPGAAGLNKEKMVHKGEGLLNNTDVQGLGAENNYSYMK